MSIPLYAVAECRLTSELFYNFDEVWCPLERIRQPDGSITVRPAIYGICFVQVQQMPALRRKVDSKYNLKQQYYPFTLHPKVAKLSELTRMQETLNAEFARKEPTVAAEPITFKRGDRVTINDPTGLLSSYEGYVQRCKSGGRARIMLSGNGHIVEIRCDWLKLVQ